MAMIWLAMLGGCCAGMAGAAAIAAGDAARVVRLQALPGGQPLARELAYFEDAGRTLSIADVLAAPQQARFALADDPLVGKEADRVLWFKLTLRLDRAQDAGREWALVVPTVSTHDLQFHGPFDRDGHAIAPSVTTGMRHPWSTRPLSSEQMAWRFRLPDTQSYTVYFRVDSTFARIYDVRAWDPVDYLQATQDKRMFDGISYGVLLGLVVFGLVLLLVFGEPLHMYYLLSCACALLAIAGFNGHTLRYPFADWPSAASAAYTVAPGLWTICKLQFGRHLLRLQHYAPRLDVVVRWMAWLLAAAVVYALWGSRPLLMFRLVQVSVVASTVILVAGAAMAVRRRYWPAVLYCIGVAVLLAGISAIVVASWGWVAWTPSQMNVTQAALVVELVVFAIAMASRLRLVLRSEQDLAVRTRQLVAALGTDALTGAASRSGLQSKADEWLAQQRPFALLLLDLDGFKTVNDRHGHAAGDAVLAELTARLQRRLGPDDVVARLGGDEFAVFVPGRHAASELAGIAGRLIGAAGSPIDHEGRSLQVGMSVGIAQYPGDGNSLAMLLRAADGAMYRSKQRHEGPAYSFAGRAAQPAGDAPGPAGQVGVP